MFSLFPTLLDFYPFAGFILRLAAGYLFILHAGRLYRTTSSVGYTHSVLARVQSVVMGGIGVLFVLGIWVQGAASVGLVMNILSIESGLARSELPSEHEVHFLLGVICLTLLILGAGPFAFDIPL